MRHIGNSSDSFFSFFFFAMACIDAYPLNANTPVDTALLFADFRCSLTGGAQGLPVAALPIHSIYRNSAQMNSDMKYNATILAVLMAIERHLEAVQKLL